MQNNKINKRSELLCRRSALESRSVKCLKRNKPTDCFLSRERYMQYFENSYLQILYCVVKAKTKI